LSRPPVTESALIVPALHLTPVVERFRLRYDPTAAAGVPPHVTILYPFLAPDQLTDGIVAEVARLLGNVAGFDYSMGELRQFEPGVLYLAPEPAAPFADLTRLVSKHFGIQPYGGAYSTVIPHLTVARSAVEDERGRIAAEIAAQLPVHGRASEAWLIAGDNAAGWKRVRSIPFTEVR
jgi:2'-5' RNA ligase